MTEPAPQKPFELSLNGGAIERRYRKLCPEVEALPWSSFDPAAHEPQKKELARTSWTFACIQEFESTAVHALAMNELIRARLPLDLTSQSTTFQRQELTHAELCARLAMVLGGGANIPDRPKRFATSKLKPELAIADLALWAFAISETYSHTMLKAGTARAKDPLFRGVRQLLAKDEAAHGRFGWQILDEVLPELGDADKARLRKTAVKAMTNLEQRAESAATRAPEQFGELTALGPFAPEDYRSTGLAALQTIRDRLQAIELA